MEYIYAALLLHKAGKKVDENGVKTVLSAAGVTVDESRVKALVAALDGVNMKTPSAKHRRTRCRSSRSAPAPQQGSTAAKEEAPEEHRRKTKRAAWQGSVPCLDKSLFPTFCLNAVSCF